MLNFKKRARLGIEIRKTRLPWRRSQPWRLKRQPWFVRIKWTANGNKAFHSESYSSRYGAENLVEAILEGRFEFEGVTYVHGQPVNPEVI